MPLLKPGYAIDVRTKRHVKIVHPKFVYSVYRTASGKMRKMYRLVGTGGSPGGAGRLSRIVSSDLKGYGVARKIGLSRKTKKHVIKRKHVGRPKAVGRPRKVGRPKTKKHVVKRKKVTKTCKRARSVLATARKRVTTDVRRRMKACHTK